MGRTACDIHVCRAPSCGRPCAHGPGSPARSGARLLQPGRIFCGVSGAGVPVAPATELGAASDAYLPCAR
eukprot:scaffold86544_cov20-Tisochrysis_lutea.AAC.3